MESQRGPGPLYILSWYVALLHSYYDLYFFLENGHWLIGDKYQNVGFFKSKKMDLDEVLNVGWLYNDRTKWKEAAIEVKGT